MVLKTERIALVALTVSFAKTLASDSISSTLALSHTLR